VNKIERINKFQKDDKIGVVFTKYTVIRFTSINMYLYTNVYPYRYIYIQIYMYIYVYIYIYLMDRMECLLADMMAGTMVENCL
jgi:hypothetical protein